MTKTTPNDGRQNMEIGFAAEIITPPVGMPLLGPSAPGTGTNDDLYVRVVVLKKKSTLVIISLDLIGLDLQTTDRIRKKIENACGLPAARIMLNFSHTHSSPFTIPFGGSSWRECKSSSWFRELPAIILRCVEKALDAKRTVFVRYHQEPLAIGFNRRKPTGQGIGMEKYADGIRIPQTDIFSFYETINEKLVAIMFAHAAHPVFIHAASTLVSADYPGFAVKHIRQASGAFALFLQGCGANINAEPLRGGFEKAAAAGKLLGQAVLNPEPNAQVLIPDFAVRVRRFELPYQPPPLPEECQKALDECRQRRQTLEKPSPWLDEHILALSELLDISRAKQKRSLSFEIQMFKIAGDTCLLGLTHEVFAEYHEWIKTISPFKNTIVLAYTNGCESYIPLARHFSEGGYEAARFPEIGSPFYYYPRLTLMPEIEKIIKTNVEEVLKFTSS